LVVLLAASPALAADLRGGDTVIIASGDVINDDLYIAANRIVINGTVNGDVLCIGDTITVDGHINGSITAIGSQIRIDGEVERSVRVAGDRAAIGGDIGNDVMAAGDDIEIIGTGMIGRDLVFAARKIDVQALVDKGVKGLGSRISLNDVVRGDVEVGVEQLTIASSASIGGNLVYVSENKAIVEPGAHIGGTTTHRLPEVREPIIPTIGVWIRVIAFLMTLITGIVIILIAPRRAEAVAASIKGKPLLSLGWGAIILFATPIAALIAFITVIGVPAGLIGLILYGLAIYLSQIAVGLFIGYWIVGYFSKVDSRGALVGAFALGFAILTLVKLIPYIGFPIWLATVVFGLGAMALSQRTLRAAKLKEAQNVA